jgi:ubiquinone/menaquinone biosynthesis C-methylase UbiE
MREPTAPAYYDRRAPEYDDWYLGRGKFAARERPGFDDELETVVATLERLPPARTLDVACGTAFLTRHLRGTITALDQSRRMLAIARERLPGATLVAGDGLALPFAADAFDRVVTGHFYGHLDGAQRKRFLAEARRVASELVVVDASRAQSEIGEEWSRRVLDDGSAWEVYKRYFTPDALLAELGGGKVLHAGAWFVVVQTHGQRRPSVVRRRLARHRVA